MKLTCWGAAGTVTGSMHLLETESGRRILVDCGLYYEKKNKDITENNRHFPFNPRGIDAVILTHAHIDHSGNLPNLVNQGFDGKIYCTPPTKDLTGYLLEDSVNIQMAAMDKTTVRKKSHKKIKKNISESLLYSYKHIKQTVEQMEMLDYNQTLSIFDDIEILFVNAGHILGAASVLIKVREENETKTIGFTGDLGNNHSKLMIDPIPLPQPDYLVTEATYGGRFHMTGKDVRDVLLEEIQNTCVNQSGKLIIPAFSVGRTQAIIFTLHQLFVEGRLPNIKIYTDSPLAIKTTRMYETYVDLLNEEAKAFHKKYGELFEFDRLYTLLNPEHSESISLDPEPCVIISAAGMVEGGRIQQHVRTNISNANSTILIAGYCAEGTFGHLLLQGLSHVVINKKERPVLAKVRQTDGFSAHPDHKGLLDYIQKSSGENTEKVIIVHSDPESAAALKDALNPQLHAEVAERGKVYELN
ncbi:MAG: MBL fold metallo-hydrolase [Bacteroidetes bacterium]|nr:MBL fold metallo-hydrolase [Bacteroidota bacterium]